MTELRDRLQAALGDAYRIQRELGGGGMSRVFLAGETALGRQVVVKVLPPETAAGVNIERFRREIQLAASLQHPHIVPLHTAGQAGDLFYYTMPLVEGESLRAKLAREGELPISEAVRILRDVVDALAYAHAHGLVHRDIKPDNILLSGNHAVVTDFGVAKAVSAASGATSLTSLGVALGTPAYMAPEQAAADPHVDHRADIYAVGALTYEMLCGRPPFTGMTPQAVLAAHVTQAPDPLIAYRATVPPALNELVMRCLAKKPADRVQRAEELLAQLEAMVTPTGGMTPTGASLVITSGTEAALRRARPVRIAAFFGAGALVVLALVYLLMTKLGLPDWVFAGTVALLALGLPIMLLTGRFEGQRAVARTTGTAVPTPLGIHRWFTWRKSLLGGAVAFTALGIAAAVYMAMRLLGIGPVGTLVASGVLKERQPILLAEFVNRTADSTLGPTLTEAFRVDLAQSPTVKLVDAKAIGEALRRMQRDAGTPLPPALAREVAEREGIKALVTGQIDPVDKGYVLSASVVSAADGQVLTAVRATAVDGAHLISALDRLSAELRERIGESFATIRSSEPLAQVTTGSLEALRKYSQAIRAADAGDYEGAAPLLEEATALDTGFAMAYRKLAVVLRNSRASEERVVAAATRAFTHRNRLSELERTLTAAYYYDQVEWDPAREVGAYRAALDIDPNSDVALNNLAIELRRQRQYAAAESLLMRGIQLGYTGVYYQNAIDVLVLQDRLADAQAMLERYAHAAPSDPNTVGERAWLLTVRHDYAGAERAIRQLREQQRTSPSWRQSTSWFLSQLSLTQGKLAQAEQHQRDAMATAQERGLTGGYVGGAVAVAMIDVRYRNRPAAALATVAAALARHPLASIPPSDRPYVGLIRLYAEAGRPAEARRLLAEYERIVSEGLRRGDPWRHGAAGALALADGRGPDAIASFRAWNDQLEFPAVGLFELAGAYERAGQPDSALALYERLVTIPDPRRLFADPYALAPTYKRLGELYEARGHRDRARDFYTKFVDLWKDADPELQPMVRDVRGRLARLAGEH